MKKRKSTKVVYRMKKVGGLYYIFKTVTERGKALRTEILCEGLSKEQAERLCKFLNCEETQDE